MTAVTHKLRRNPDVISQILDNEAILLHIQKEVYYSLDETGLRIWQLLGEYGELQPVLSQMQKEFNVDELTLKNDLNRIVDELIKEGLLNSD